MVEYEEYGGFKVISAVLPDTVPDSAAPLPPVIRCEGCKHYSDSAGRCNVHPQFAIRVMPDDFCSRGERRTGHE